MASDNEDFSAASGGRLSGVNQLQQIAAGVAGG